MALGRIEEETGGPVFTVWERVAPPEEVDQLLNLVRTASLLSKPGDVWKRRVEQVTGLPFAFELAVA